MDKISKILLIINLLHHRRYVTIADMRAMCQICDRTAYRYINAISAAHIPVYFDKSVRGYCLANRGRLELSSLDANEALLVALGLNLLSTRVSGTYRQDIEALARKVITSLEVPLEDLWRTCRQRVATDTDGRDLSELITDLVVQLAVTQGRKLVLLSTGDSGGPRNVELKSPILAFSDRWIVQEKGSGAESAVPVAEIHKAKVM